MRRLVGLWFLELLFDGVLWLVMTTTGRIVLACAIVITFMALIKRARHTDAMTVPASSESLAKPANAWTAMQRDEFARDLPRHRRSIHTVEAFGEQNTHLRVVVWGPPAIRSAFAEIRNDCRARGFTLVEFCDPRGARLERFRNF
jgi:hypothetical protein